MVGDYIKFNFDLKDRILNDKTIRKAIKINDKECIIQWIGNRTNIIKYETTRIKTISDSIYRRDINVLEVVGKW